MAPTKQRHFGLLCLFRVALSGWYCQPNALVHPTDAYVYAIKALTLTCLKEHAMISHIQACIPALTLTFHEECLFRGTMCIHLWKA